MADRALGQRCGYRQAGDSTYSIDPGRTFNGVVIGWLDNGDDPFLARLLRDVPPGCPPVLDIVPAADLTGPHPAGATDAPGALVTAPAVLQLTRIANCRIVVSRWDDPDPLPADGDPGDYCPGWTIGVGMCDGCPGGGLDVRARTLAEAVALSDACERVLLTGRRARAEAAILADYARAADEGWGAAATYRSVARRLMAAAQRG